MAPHFVQLALQYKLACTQSLRAAISCLDMQSSISDWTVGLTLFLAQDEVKHWLHLGNLTRMSDH